MNTREVRTYLDFSVYPNPEYGCEFVYKKIHMKRFFLLCAIGLTISCQPTDKSTTSMDDSNTSERVKDLMAKMTLEDKVGEMTQIAIDVISVKDENGNLAEPHQLDESMLRKVLVDLRVGSILNVAGHGYTREHWHEVIQAIQDMAKEKSTGIPVLYGIDAIHGANYTLGSTLFPQEIAMAATWNPGLAEKASHIAAYETRASWIPWTFAPVLDIGRNPQWPRLWETFGEDILLASDMGEAYVRGFQGDDPADPEQIAACLKHFLGYSMPMTGHDRTQAWIPERQLREYIAPTFQRAIDAGALTIMINSGEINGIPVHCNKAILTDLLRTEMGFEGLAVTDWDDITYLYTRYHVARDYKESIKMAINAGVDMAMVPFNLEFPVLLKELVEEGEVPMWRIDEAVERILTVKERLGLFDNPYYADHDYSKFGSEEFAEESFQAALECITLLKNDGGVLPLAKDSKVLVTGPTANSMMNLNGGWTRTWQGNNPDYDAEEGKKTILEAIQDKLGAGRVTYVPGATFDALTDGPIAASAARQVDAVVVCLGEMNYTETPGNIDDISLPAAQGQLVEAVAQSGKPVILVLVEGRPRVLGKWEEKTAAALQAYLPGSEGGRAVAEVLFGDYNPNGKLPYTYPRYVNTLRTYDHKGPDRVDNKGGENAINPQWPFGHGLSYTTFAYSDLQLSSKEWSMGDSLQISVQVANTGQRAGKEVVQLYITDQVASITPSVKRLRGYAKVALEAGESKTVTFTIRAKDLAFVGVDNKWITEPGAFTAQVGGLETEFVLNN